MFIFRALLRGWTQASRQTDLHNIKPYDPLFLWHLSIGLLVGRFYLSLGKLVLFLSGLVPRKGLFVIVNRMCSTAAAR